MRPCIRIACRLSREIALESGNRVFFAGRGNFTFGALGQNAIALEEDKTEGFILARIFVDGPDDFFYFSKLLEIR